MSAAPETPASQPAAAPSAPQRVKPEVKLSDETILERAIRRSIENPVIPAATIVAFGSVLFGARRLFARDSKGLQKSMRIRVGAQAVAFAALAVSFSYEAIKTAKPKEAAAEPQAQVAPAVPKASA